jgi:Xaa-Pro aminopeptidase
MKTSVPNEFFADNRKRLKKLFGGLAPIVITANGQLQRSSDTPFPFRQDSNFWYLTGVDEPDIILVIDKQKEYLIMPERDARLLTFDGDIDLDALRQTSGISEILDHKEGWSRLGKRLKKVKHVASLEPSKPYVASLQLYTNPARRRLVRTMKRYNDQLALIDLRPQLTSLRMIKSELELAAIQSAIDHTGNIFELINRNYSSYKHEYEIAADVQAYLFRNQLQEAYAPIIAGGLNAVTLHYIKNNAPLKAKDCLLLDIGAADSYYAADITRTITSSPTKRQQAVYNAVLSVQQFATERLKPGVLIKEYEAEVEHFMGEKLRELGLIRAIDHTNVRTFYPHATSHFLGLDVHDVGDYARPLEPGMVLTVEPGIYIAAEALGIRLEDNIVITDKGNTVLSSKLPKTLNLPTIDSK